MTSTSISSDRSQPQRDLRTRVYQALVGRTVQSSSAVMLVILNALALAVCGLAFLFWLLGAAMAAGTTTPSMDLWLARMLWSLGIAAGSFAWVIVQLAIGRRWPRGVQLLAGLAVLAALLLYVLAPPGIHSPLP